MFGVNTFGTTSPLCGNVGTKINLPPNVRPWVVCIRCPRLRAIRKGDINPPRIGLISLCPILGMGEPWVAEYGVCCLFSYFVYHFSATGKKC